MRQSVSTATIHAGNQFMMDYIVNGADKTFASTTARMCSTISKPTSLTQHCMRRDVYGAARAASERAK